MIEVALIVVGVIVIVGCVVCAWIALRRANIAVSSKNTD